MASSNTANWSVYSRKRKANVEELSWWFQGPKYLQFASRATRTHLTPTTYQQSRQLFIRHKLARQSKIRDLLSGKKKKPQKKNQKQWLREERRPLIDRDVLHSICQLQTTKLSASRRVGNSWEGIWTTRPSGQHRCFTPEGCGFHSGGAFYVPPICSHRLSEALICLLMWVCVC